MASATVRGNPGTFTLAGPESSTTAEPCGARATSGTSPGGCSSIGADTIVHIADTPSLAIDSNGDPADPKRCGANGGAAYLPNTWTSQTVIVTIVGDTRVEPNEVFYLDLSSPSGATMGKSRSTVTITVAPVNDPPTAGPQPAITTAEDTAAEVTLVSFDLDGDVLDHQLAYWRERLAEVGRRVLWEGAQPVEIVEA